MKQVSTIVLLLLLLNARPSAEDAAKPSNQETNARIGYVDCSSRENKDLVPILLNVCTRLPAGNLNCGQQITVLERQGPWMKITLSDGIPRYIDANVLSQVNDKFVAFDANSGVSDKGVPLCPTRTGEGVSAPRAVYMPDCEYTDKARKAHIEGKLVLSLVVGKDGRPRDVRVDRGLGYGLDQAAVKTLRRWRFEPALRDGVPIEARINIEVSLRILK